MYDFVANKLQCFYGHLQNKDRHGRNYLSQEHSGRLTQKVVYPVLAIIRACHCNNAKFQID
jgi:hypothetical protein